MKQSPESFPSPDEKRWRQISGFLRDALELPHDQRSAYLDVACGADADLRAKVESLLAASQQPVQLAALAFEPVTTTLNLEQAAAPLLKPGQLVAHYEIVQKIGEGGMGEVYKAIDKHLGRTVALKTILDPCKDWRTKGYFAREARAASALNHPNIVTIYEFNCAEGLDFIAMEYVEGATLGQLLSGGGIPLATLIDYARQAASGIAAAHAAGVVHRDLKPGNIMVTPGGTVKVLDFGLARQESSSDPELTKSLTLTRTGAISGTPAYMSPEQVLGEPVGPASDIFSFGVVLYELACGSRPFQGKNARKMLDQVAHQNPPPPAELKPGIPPALAALIEHCLCKVPAERPASMREVAVVLGDVVAGMGGTAQKPNVSAPFSCRRWLIGGTAALVALAAGVRFQLLPKHTPAAPWLPYSIEAQKMNAGHEEGLPYSASPTDTFQGGWRFRLRIQPPQAGFVYVVNKGLDEKGAERFWILDHRAADQSVLTRWFHFDQNPGTEQLWLLWSAQRLSPIEDALLDSADGSVRSPATASALEQLLAGLKTGQPGIQGELLELKHQ
jgi:hypothetical protein